MLREKEANHPTYNISDFMLVNGYCTHRIQREYIYTESEVPRAKPIGSTGLALNTFFKRTVYPQFEICHKTFTCMRKIKNKQEENGKENIEAETKLV